MLSAELQDLLQKYKSRKDGKNAFQLIRIQLAILALNIQETIRLHKEPYNKRYVKKADE